MMYRTSKTPARPATKPALIGSGMLYLFPGRMMALQALRAAVRRTF